ncbi:MAG TPA: T9SS type A sorting domain-containing protein, partial [Bacteroidia bacterium]|nr:T9SS type A sorting domain-containing protein [Bacteroidia bacterium]
MFSHNGKIWYQTTGSPGSQICTIEWQHMYFWGASADYSDDANFQIQLCEGTNAINIIYGNAFESGHYSRNAQIGLRGIANTDYNLIDDQGGTLQWNAVTASTTGGNNLTKLWGISNTNEPGPGLTYTWTPPATSCPPLTIGEIKNENSVSLYPNPFRESTTISVQGENVNGKKTISVFDVTGKEIIVASFEGSTYVISKNSLAEGMYLFLVKNEKEETIGKGKLLVK